jgi:hypothetical protein
LGVVNAGAGLWFQDDSYGVSLYPVAQLCINTLFGVFSIIPVIVVIYYAGELVWRDTDRRIGDIIDATPVPDWAFVVPKILAMALVLAALLTGSILTAMLVQLLKSYTYVEVWKYIAWYLVPLTISFTSFAVLALFVQAIVPQKFIGWGLMVVYIVASMVSPRLGYEHNLYRFGGGIAGPIVPLSDMNGLGEAGSAPGGYAATGRLSAWRWPCLPTCSGAAASKSRCSAGSAAYHAACPAPRVVCWRLAWSARC